MILYINNTARNGDSICVEDMLWDVYGYTNDILIGFDTATVLQNLLVRIYEATKTTIQLLKLGP